MALLVPGIGEKQLHCRQAAVGNHLRQHFDRVVIDQAQVRNPGFGDAVQAMTDAGPVDLDTQVILLRVAGGLFDQGFAVTETDFQDYRVIIAKGFDQVQRIRTVVDAVCRPVMLQRMLLAAGEPALAQHVGADPAVAGFHAADREYGSGDQTFDRRGGRGEAFAWHAAGEESFAAGSDCFFHR